MPNDLPPSVKSEIDERAKLLGETKAEQEQLRKREVLKAFDALDEIGQPDEKKGIAATKKAMQADKDQQFAAKADRISWLKSKADKSKNRQYDYFPHVKTLVDYELSWLALPPRYSVKSELTLKGIKLVLKDRFGRIHIGGFKPSGLALYDEQACRSSVNKIDDLINKLEENPANGIYLK